MSLSVLSLFGIPSPHSEAQVARVAGLVLGLFGI